MKKKYNVIFFTGAGISVDSGIPTFENQPELRKKLSRNFANEHPEEYRQAIIQMLNTTENAVPNAAHKAIAAYGFPVVTMNVDRLHIKAGSQEVIEVHGTLPTRKQVEEHDFPLVYDGIVLYGDLSPMYEKATQMVKSLEYKNSYFIVVGTSFYTGISEQLLEVAKNRCAHIIVVNDSASERVPKICETLSKKFFIKGNKENEYE